MNNSVQGVRREFYDHLLESYLPLSGFDFQDFNIPSFYLKIEGILTHHLDAPLSTTEFDRLIFEIHQRFLQNNEGLDWNEYLIQIDHSEFTVGLFNRLAYDLYAMMDPLGIYDHDIGVPMDFLGIYDDIEVFAIKYLQLFHVPLVENVKVSYNTHNH